MDHNFEEILQHGNASLKDSAFNSIENPEKNSLSFLL